MFSENASFVFHIVLTVCSHQCHTIQQQQKLSKNLLFLFFKKTQPRYTTFVSFQYLSLIFRSFPLAIVSTLI